MILSVERQLHDAVSEAIRRQYGIDAPAFDVEVPPTRALGDLAVPVAFQLARALKKPPRAIAQELVAALGVLPGVDRIAAAPNGFLNVFLDRARFLRERLSGDLPPEPAPAEKTIVE